MATLPTQLQGSLRILHSIASVDPALGGPFEALRQFATITRQRGHHVEVVSLDDPASAWVAACPIPCHALGPALGNYRYTSKFVPWLRENLRNYDVVIIEGLWQYHAFGSWSALKATGTPYVVFTHGMLDPWFKRTFPLKHLKKYLYWSWGERRTLRDADAVLFTCEEERRLARTSFPRYQARERILSLGIETPPSDRDTLKRRFLSRFSELTGKRLLLFLGRVHPKKGPDLLIAGFRKLLDQLPGEVTADLHVVIAGPAEDRYAVRMRNLVDSLALTDRVTWTGMVSGDLKWGAFYAADAFGLASHQENFGIAVVEALACGLPVLISRQVNIWPTVQHAGAGWVDKDDLAGTEAMLKEWALSSDQERVQRGARARTCFEENFTIARAGDAFVELLNSVAASRHTRSQHSK